MRKNKVLVILLIIIGIGFAMPIAIHREYHVFHRNLFFPFIPTMVIDVEDSLYNEIREIHDQTHSVRPIAGVYFFCIDKDLYDINSPLKFLKNFLFLKKVTVTDMVVKENQYIHYELDYRTFFNIRYKKGVVTEKIFPNLARDASRFYCR